MKPKKFENIKEERRFYAYIEQQLKNNKEMINDLNYILSTTRDIRHKLLIVASLIDVTDNIDHLKEIQSGTKLKKDYILQPRMIRKFIEACNKNNITGNKKIQICVVNTTGKHAEVKYIDKGILTPLAALNVSTTEKFLKMLPEVFPNRKDWSKCDILDQSSKVICSFEK